MIGTTDDDGRFEVRVRDARGAARDRLRHGPRIVRPRLHRGRARRSDPGRVELLRPRSARGGLNETRVRARPEHPEETKQTLTSAELTTVPGTLGDPLRVLQNMPGVARAPFGLGLLIVRGANPSDTGVFIGGEPIPVLYHFLAGPSVFTRQPDRQDRLLPGRLRRPLRPLHGRRRRRRHQERRRPHAARRGRHQPARFVGLTSKVRCRAACAPASRSGAATSTRCCRWCCPTSCRRARARRSSPSRRCTGTTRRASTRISPGGGRVALPAYGSSDSLEIISGDPTVELASNTHIGFHHVMGEWVTALGRWSSRLSATYGYGDQSFVDRAPSAATSATTASRRARTSAGASARRSRCRRGSTSSSATTGRTTTTCPFPREGRTIGATMPPQMVDVEPLALRHGAGRCTSRRSEPTPRLRLVPGLRFDYYHVVETDKFSSTRAWRCAGTLTPRLALKAAVGIYHQLPEPGVPRPRSATRTCCCPGPTSTRSASSGDSPRPTS